MHKLYGWLATLAGVNITFQSSDPCIECGQLIDENRDQQLIIIINHAHNKRKTEIALPNTTQCVKSVFGEKKIINTGKGFEIALARYEIAAFLCQKG